MKEMNWVLLSGLIAILTSCAHRGSVPLDSPRPQERPKALEKSGLLIVYSAWERLSSGDPNHLHHTPYQILSENGQLISKVSNYWGGPNEEPVPVNLPEGAYQVRAENPHHVRVTVPVVVRAGQTTNLYLDGSTRPNP